MSPWKSIRYRLEELGCGLLAWGIPRLSRRTCHRLAHVAGALAFRFDRRGRAVALANLECAFGEEYTPLRRREIARASYQNFARTMLFLFWARRPAGEDFAQHLCIEGFDAVQERATRERRGVVFIGVHYSNWEWSGIAIGAGGFSPLVVAEHFKNPRLDRFFTGARQVSGLQIIRQENSILRMLKAVKRGGSTGLLIDLSLRPSQAATVIEGFGMQMSVSLLHAVLAQRAGALLVPLQTLPQADGSFHSIAHAPLEVPAGASVPQIAQLCWDVFEPLLRAQPEHWLWPYKHFRYRPKNATREYPFYANESANFEKLLQRTQTSSTELPAGE